MGKILNKLEHLITLAGRALADRQVCRIFRIPGAMTATPCDFAGYAADGRAILIEAKMVDRSYLPLGKSPGLKPHQWNELCDAQRAGALAIIAWQRGDAVALISPTQAALLAGTSRSIPWQDKWIDAASRIDDLLAGFVIGSQAIPRPRPSVEPESLRPRPLSARYRAPHGQ